MERVEKQTAVRWLFKWMIYNKDSIIEERLQTLEQAKAMFEQQIIEAYNQGSEAGYELAKNDDFIEGYKTKDAEQYYNETFKSE